MQAWISREAAMISSVSKYFDHDSKEWKPTQTAEVVTFKQGEWSLFYNGLLHPATWNSKGAAQAHGDRCIREGRMLP